MTVARHASSIKACGLIAFALIALLARDAVVLCMAATVLVNGLLCHLTNHPCCVGWDVLVNVFLIGYVNRTTDWQPHTALLTAVAALGFLASWSSPNNTTCSAVHVVCVQWTCALALWHFSPPEGR